MRGDRRAKREVRREEREASCKILPKYSESRSGTVRKGFGPPREERREQSERRDKREERREEGREQVRREEKR